MISTSLHHFTPPKGWMNDPNGLIFHDGVYHLFYQHYPDDTVWGPMHWGHATSRDLLNWEHLPIALAPDESGYIFSGCVVIDHQNTSGLARGGEAPWIALFTHHDFHQKQAGATDFESQSLAISYDEGINWEPYQGNPVLPNPGDRIDFRDPNVFWHEATRSWIMCLAVTQRIEIYTSPDLIHWTFASAFGTHLPPAKGVWECPCLFQIAQAEDGGNAWVLLVSLNPGGPQGGSGTQYFVGTFDGKSFSLEPDWNPAEPVWLDHGADNYAGLIWRGESSSNQKHFIAWMNNWKYAMQPPASLQSGQMTLPRVLTLSRLPQGSRLCMQPVLPGDLSAAEPARFEPLPASVGTANLRTATDEAFKIIDISLSDPAATTGLEITLTNPAGQKVRTGYCAQMQTYFIDRSGISDALSARMDSPPRSVPHPVTFQVILSRNGVELFADGGLTCLTALIFPETPLSAITLTLAQRGGETILTSMTP